MAKTPAIYTIAIEPSQGDTDLLAVTGVGTAFEGAEGLRFRDFTDGTSNTMVAVTVKGEHRVPWTKPADIQIDDQFAEKVGPGNDELFLALACDGAPVVIKRRLTKGNLRNLFTRSGRERIPADALPTENSEPLAQIRILTISATNTYATKGSTL